MRSTVERALGLVVLAAASPVLALLALAVRLRLGRPVLFRQERLGKDQQPFVVHKLRTMTEERDPTGRLLPDADRLTPLGRWLRSTSLDELPELWNVVRGEMAFVGPRPLPVEYEDRYSPDERRRHEVLPGLTGWAQVHGRNAVDWDERLRLDVWYVDHRSLRLDLQIVRRTIGQVLRREGITGPDRVTMHELPPERVRG
jgi:lipopolysaccharide/colanic/teichoic acid biosynthesis glycosyltransferase